MGMLRVESRALFLSRFDFVLVLLIVKYNSFFVSLKFSSFLIGDEYSGVWEREY